MLLAVCAGLLRHRCDCSSCSGRLGACCKAEVDVPQQRHHVGKQDLIAGRDKPAGHIA